MDLIAHLNYSYPGTPKTEPLASHSSSGVRDIQSIQDQTYQENRSICSNPGWTTQASLSLDFSAGYGSTSTSPRGVDHSELPGPVEAYYMDVSTGLWDHYIPSSSDKITCTDHCPLDEIFGATRPSQAKSGFIHLPQNGAARGHPRHASVFTYPLPAKQQFDDVLHIPLLAVDNCMSGTGLVVDFLCSDWGIGVQVQGIPMSDLLHGNVSGLESPHQHVLNGLGLTDLRLNILVISAFGTGGKTLTRAELGYEVSLAFAEFFYRITSESISSAQPGPYTISSSSSGSPSPGIRFDQLHLITVQNTSRGEWVAEIRAVFIS